MPAEGWALQRYALSVPFVKVLAGLLLAIAVGCARHPQLVRALVFMLLVACASSPAQRTVAPAPPAVPAEPALVPSCHGPRDAAAATAAAKLCELTFREILALAADDRARWAEMYVTGCAALYSDPACRAAWPTLTDTTLPLPERISRIDAACAHRDEPIPALYANRVFLMKHREILACDGGPPRLAAMFYARVELERRLGPGDEVHLWLDHDDGRYVFWSLDGTVDLGDADPTAARLEEAIWPYGGEDFSRTSLVVYLSPWTFPLIDELKEALHKLPFRAVIIVPP